MSSMMAATMSPFLSLKRPLACGEAVARVREWTRRRFSLPGDAVISVAEIACGLPGCPPLETVVVFWTAHTTRHHFKIFKPVAQVTIDDLPFAWQRDALAVPPGAGVRLLLSGVRWGYCPRSHRCIFGVLHLMIQ